MTTIRLLTGTAAWPRMASIEGLRLRAGRGLGVGASFGNVPSRGNAGMNERHDGGRVCAAGEAMR